jgi:hypothetical protein
VKKAFVAAALVLAACGGSEHTAPCIVEYLFSPWAACQPNGTQTRTVLSATPSVPGCVPLTQPTLTQSCVYVPPPPVCPTTAPLVCPNGTGACCPLSMPYYCPSVGLCFTSLPTALQCGAAGFVICS